MCGHLPASFSRHIAYVGPPDTANGRIQARKVGCDLSTKWATTVFSGQIVPFLALWDDVIAGVAAPQIQRLSTEHARGCLWCRGSRWVPENASERGLLKKEPARNLHYHSKG